MAKKEIRKIIYFDKETIRNILQEQHHGEYSKTTDVVRSAQNDGALEVSTKIKLDVPFISRLSFLFDGKLNASYVIKKDSTTTISSTEISEFEKLKPQLISTTQRTVPCVTNLTDLPENAVTQGIHIVEKSKTCGRIKERRRKQDIGAVATSRVAIVSSRMR